LVAALCVTPVAVSLAVTLAPGITAPVESVTVPVMVPVTLCAVSEAADAKRRSANDE
jgi:hypothetical protein